MGPLNRFVERDDSTLYIEDKVEKGSRVVVIYHYDPLGKILATYGEGVYDGMFAINISEEAVWKGYLSQLPADQEPDITEEEAMKILEEDGGTREEVNHARVTLDQGGVVWGFHGSIISVESFEKTVKPSLEKAGGQLIVMKAPEIDVTYVKEVEDDKYRK